MPSNKHPGRRGDPISAHPLTADQLVSDIFKIKAGRREEDHGQQAGEKEVNTTLYIGASIFFVAGLFLILFPNAAKRWFDTDPRYQIRPTIKSLELKSEGSMRALGIGLLVVAGLVAYYSYAVRWPG